MLGLFRSIYFPLSVITTIIIAFPIFLIRPFNLENTFIFQRIFNFIAVPLMGFKIKIEGQNYIQENIPSVVIGNHQHNLDVLMFSVGFPKRVLVIGKKEIAYIPIFGQAYWLAGHILLNRQSNHHAVNVLGDVERKMLQDNVSILVFPEGHRNQGEELLPFKKGAFYTAINAQVPIICFSVSSYARNMNLNNLQAAKMHIKFHPPIETKGLTKADIPKLMEQTYHIIKNGRDELDKLINII